MLIQTPLQLKSIFHCIMFITQLRLVTLLQIFFSASLRLGWWKRPTSRLVKLSGETSVHPWGQLMNCFVLAFRLWMPLFLFVRVSFSTKCLMLIHPFTSSGLQRFSLLCQQYCNQLPQCFKIWFGDVFFPAK